jgi:hypothetical protein
MDMPLNAYDFDANEDNIIEANRESNELIYSFFDFIYAIMSHIDLISKCLAISRVPINNSIKFLPNSYRQLGYINLDIESCKILHKHGCDLKAMLHIAYHVSNYDSMRYIIDNMSDIIITDLYNTTYFSLGLCNILIIDKIYELQDKYLIHLLRNILGKDDDPEDG